MPQLTNILHVEDEPDIREIAAIGLVEIAGYNVKSCGTPAEALEAARATPQPDMLLLDVMMPEMDGTDLLQELRRVPGLEQIPAVFVTAKTDAQDVAPLMAAGAIGIVPKPFDPMTVGQTVQSLWNNHAGAK